MKAAAKPINERKFHMAYVRNILVSFGVFWLSLWVAPVLGWPLDKLTNRITYTDTIFDALALGVINSLDRALAAILAGVLVTVVVKGRKAELWAVIIAGLYLLNAPRYHHLGPTTSWDRTWQDVAVVFPAIACVAAAAIAAHFWAHSTLESN
jgi:hypothetical protein